MTWREEALQHALAEAPNESCGLLVVVKGVEEYWPCRNLSPDPSELFVLDPDDWADAEDAGEVLRVIHSHPIGSPEPSAADKIACNASNLPWEIVSPVTGDWAAFEPSGYKVPLIGRPWIWAVTDCWTLVRDWYGTQGIELPDWPRPKSADAFQAAPMFDDLWASAGFRELEADEPLSVGDALLFDLGGCLNHVGVLVEPQAVLHHLRGRLSSRDTYGALLLKCTRRRLRHASQD